MKEIDIKIKLIKWLMNNNNSDVLLGSEFRFDFGSRRADVITLAGNFEAVAYEIKGIGDSLRTLRQQCDGYKLYFDKCYVVCEKENLALVRKNTPAFIGLLVIDGDSFRQYRKAKHNKLLDGVMLSSTINTNFLRKEMSDRKSSKVDLCKKYATNRNLKEIKLISRHFLKKKIEVQFNIFSKEIGQEINYDDIATLDRMPALQII